MNSNFEVCRPPSLRDKIAFTTRLSCALATRIVAVSSAVKKELVEIGIPGHKVIVQSNPRRNLCRQDLDRDEVRLSLGYSQEAIVIATVGHAVPVKRWDLLLEAFHLVARAEKGMQLLMVGSIDAASEKEHFSTLSDYISRNNFQKRVHFTGHVEDISRILAAADIFDLPSRSEGSSNILIEAMELGFPCIASRVGNAEDLIQTGVNGLLVRRNDSNELGHALESLVKDGRLRARLMDNTRLPAHVPDIAEHGERIAAVYESQLFTQD